MILKLIPHPSRPPSRVTAIEAEFAPDHLRFRVEGAEALLLPEPAAPERTDELWQTTCFELFIKPVGGEGYVEFNFSPSTRWAAYAFDGYRDGMRDLPVSADPVISAADGAWDVRLALADLPLGDWRVSLSVVIEETDGAKSFWALAHPEDGPDFHHDACFALAIPAPRTA